MKSKRYKGCKGCTIVEILKKKGMSYKIFEQKEFIVNYAKEPEVDGHIVIQPAGHAEQLADLCEQQAVKLMQLIWKYCQAVQTVLKPKKIYVYSFNEAKDYHLHFHIKPKAISVPDELAGPCYVNWTDPREEVRVNREHIEKVIKQIKDAMKTSSSSHGKPPT
jgi:diadenosine tetraphosphate (Ap4A) HIT family hydrolase